MQYTVLIWPLCTEIGAKLLHEVPLISPFFPRRHINIHPSLQSNFYLCAQSCRTTTAVTVGIWTPNLRSCLCTHVSQQPTPTGCRQVHCMQALSIQVSPSEKCFPSKTHSAATHGGFLRMFILLLKSRKDFRALDLTSGVEVALHGCSRATAGPQKKPCSCKHEVHPGGLHLHLVWSGQPLVPLLHSLLYLYNPRLYDCGVEVWSAPSCGPQAWLEKVSAVPSTGELGGGGLHGGKEKGILHLGTVPGTLEITSLRFGGHEPPKW